MNAVGVAALASWLAGEAFGAIMFYSRSRRRRQRGKIPRRLHGHAMLGCCGLLSWIGFVLGKSVGLAWLAIGLLVAALGVGISTLRLWTRYSARRLEAGGPRQRYHATLGITTDEMLARAVEDEALTTKLVDDLVASLLARPDPAIRRPPRRPGAVVHTVHGMLAMSTVLFAFLAAVSAS
ncbi:MAG TPA: hypothetical protein VFQ44_12855 [Streptosporangiaceae bacterium]|nr:hypothetical protein [Streptosporangiaceae bacterium]